MRRASSGRRDDEGFTLIELLIAVAIIGIIAAVAIVNLLGALDRSRQSSTMSTIRNVSQAVAAYHTDLGFMPSGSLTFPELAVILGDGGLYKNLGPEDAWGNLMSWESDGVDYTVESYGKDGVDGPADISHSSRRVFENDIVLVNGAFRASPEND